MKKILTVAMALLIAVGGALNAQDAKEIRKQRSLKEFFLIRFDFRLLGDVAF